MKTITDISAEILKLQKQNIEFCVATVIRAQAATAAKAGNKAIIKQDKIIGFIGGMCVQGAAKKAANSALNTGQAKLIRIKPTDEVTKDKDFDGVELHKSGCPSKGTIDLFIEPIKQAQQLFILGSSNVAISLANLAVHMSYKVTILSGKDTIAKKALVSSIKVTKGLDLEKYEINPNDLVVVATQGKEDLLALKNSLRTNAKYVAKVCSPKKAKHLLAKITKEDQITKAQIKRLKAPAGLDIKGITPEEIAISILAEIIQKQRKKT